MDNEVSHPVWKATYHQKPQGITKEEFGLDLYECIKAIGGIKQLDRMLKVKPAHQEYLKRRAILKADMTRYYQKLTDTDAAEVARRYPWVLT